MGFTQVSASNITDLNGNKLASGTILFLATDQNDKPINFQVGGGGQALRRAISATVTNGAIAAGLQVPDPATTSPSGILYRIWVRDAASGNLVLDYRKVAFQGSSFNLDNYVPSASVVPPPSTGAVTGPLNVNGDTSVTGTISGGTAKFSDLIPEGPIADVRAYGAKGDGATDDTTAVQSALSSGLPAVHIPKGSYVVGTVTIPTGVRLIFGAGSLVQKSAGADVLYSAAAGNIRIHGLTFVGVGGSTLGANTDNAIRFAGASTLSGIRIDHCTFTGFLHSSAYVLNATDVWFCDNLTYASAEGVRFEGVSNLVVARNVFRDTALANTQFQACIAFPGTSGGQAVCQRVTVAENTVSGYANSQAILIHAGIDFRILGNTLLGVNQGVGCAPVVAGDTIQDIVVEGLIYESTTVTAGPPSSGNQGVYIGGFDALHPATHVMVRGCTIRNANTVDLSTGEGGIMLSFVSDGQVDGNMIKGCAGAGIILTNPCLRLSMRHNTILDVAVAGGLAEGIYAVAGSGAHSGVVEHNYVDNVVDGLRFDSVAASLVIGANQITTYTTKFSGASNVTVRTDFDGILGAATLTLGGGSGLGTTNQVGSGSIVMSSELPLVGQTGSFGGAPMTAGQRVTATITVTGAQPGMSATASPQTDPGAGFCWHAWVSAANQVSVAITCIAAGTPTATAYNVRVIQ